LLAAYQAPPLDEATDEALIDFMDRRKGSFEDQDY
jgi:trimethylamine--corrinoid protein Co-methyltransferase